jgi:hypothetical protein
MLQAYENLKNLVTAAEDDVRRAAGGNKAAGTRVRKSMQEIKNAAQTLRLKVLEGRDSGEAGTPPAAPEAPASEAGGPPLATP